MATYKVAAVAIACTFIIATVEAVSEEGTGAENKTAKLLPVFQVVRFPNDACEVTGGSKNGTCYTEEECSSKGGTNGGSCASGFGVCCTFTLTCGGSSSENCTYFTVSGASDGLCTADICKASSDICQIRLDFNTMVITGPTTTTTTVLKAIAGKPTSGLAAGAGDTYADQGRCYTDALTITNQNTVPVICGTLTGHHVYFDASDACNSIDFQLGEVANGATKATRSWDIKVTQYTCGYINQAPQGCDQWFYASSGTGYVQSFNFVNGIHLAEQSQTICIRREQGYCRLCFSADATTDFEISEGGTDIIISGTQCCAYGADGLGAGGAGAYDCVMIPGAVKNSSPEAIVPNSVCGDAGLGSAKGTTAATVCTTSMPFRIDFHTDSYEDGSAEAAAINAGFKLRYFQVAC